MTGTSGYDPAGAGFFDDLFSQFLQYNEQF
jgi:hypothetical protein